MRFNNKLVEVVLDTIMTFVTSKSSNYLPCGCVSSITPDVPSISPSEPSIAPDVLSITPDVPSIKPCVPSISPDLRSITPDVPSITPDVPSISPSEPSISSRVLLKLPSVPSILPAMAVPTISPCEPLKSPCVPLTVADVVKQSKPGNKKSWLDLVWSNMIGFACLHGLALYGWYLCFSGQMKLATFVWAFVAAYISVLGTTVGAHRLFTHKCFKANQPVRLGLLAAFTMAGQNCLWVWTRDHRQHHKYSDTDGDPHNASRGFFFSHIGWLMVRKQPEVIELGKRIDMSDMNADPWIMFQKRHYKVLFLIFSVALPTLVPYYFWNEHLWTSFVFCFVTRLTGVLNGTWLVNSAAHMFGNRPFTKDILPTENWLVSLIGLGEGWHNYHHSFPWDYKAAELGRDLNFSATLIEFFVARGWAWDLRAVTPHMVRYRCLKRGDGSHPEHFMGSLPPTKDELNELNHCGLKATADTDQSEQ